MTAIVAAVLAGCGSSAKQSASTTSSAVGCSTAGATATASTKSYRYVLDVGPVEEMYAPGHVPPGASGEVMFAGTMTMASGADAEHIEVHICQASNYHVIIGANPKITLTDLTTGKTDNVPVTTMQGIGMSQSDYHYGNNMIVTPGHRFSVTVSLNGQTATMDFTRPMAAVPGSSTTTTGNMPGMSTTSTTTTGNMPGMSTTSSTTMNMGSG